MTLGELYNISKKILKNSNIESYSFDASQLIMKFFSMDKTKFLMSYDNEIDTTMSDAFIDVLKQRADGKPLQYILKTWNFMGFDFFIDEGVLIPRDDTEVLVRECIKYIEEKKVLNVIDLCSGSGIIPITISKLTNVKKIYAAEISELAIFYLNKNIKKHETTNIIPVKTDVIKDVFYKENNIDLIISNPPYIPTTEIKSLQREIMYEPIIALDGGYDGLKFYKIFSSTWLHKLKSGGRIYVEVGKGQANDVKNIFMQNPFVSSTKTFLDINNIERVVMAEKI